MGLGPASVKLYLELWQRGFFKNINAVMEMGSQDLGVRKAFFDNLVRAAGIRNYDEEKFENLRNWPGHPRVSARRFYELLGAKEYSCIDLSKVYGAIPHDLNTPLDDASLYGRYDLVTDHGTNEHVFNAPETYRTMHRLCKLGGLMVIQQCVYGGNGYYNFDLSFFEGMAAANNYRILFSSFVVTVPRKYLTVAERETVTTGSKDGYGNDELHIPLSNELLDIVNWSKDSRELGICYAFVKQSGDDFNYAYQGALQSQVGGNAGYELQFLPDPPSRSYIPIAGAGLESVSGKRLLRALTRRGIKKIKAYAGLR